MENEVEEPVPKYNYISPEEYLRLERASFEKHEYYKGEIFAMSGASNRHVIIVKNLNTIILPHLKGNACNMYGNDLRVHIPENSLYAYPDLSVFCGKLKIADADDDTVVGPSAIIEVLSKSTKNYDKGLKFTFYRATPSLQEYILVDSTTMAVEIFTRQPDDKWLLAEYKVESDSFPFKTIGLTLKLADIYEDIEFNQTLLS